MTPVTVNKFENENKFYLNQLLNDSIPGDDYDSERRVEDFSEYRDFVYDALLNSFGELKHEEVNGLETYLRTERDKIDNDFYYEVLYKKYQDTLEEKYNEYRRDRDRELIDGRYIPVVHDKKNSCYALQTQCLTLMHFMKICNDYFESVTAFRSEIMNVPLLEEGNFQYQITWVHPFGEQAEIIVVHANYLAAAELVAKYKIATENKISVLSIQILKAQQIV
ncbi:hypothetical protein [Solibacillus sp. NPDC093137]|uniref:hypothetical protein n=1 Tax=Solibacillus sp. NPDC093137 TaxID=3390678 RepID=UPI003D021810